MSEAIKTARRNRLLSSGSDIEGNIDQLIPRGSPGNFHPPLSASKEEIQVQQASAIPSTSRILPPQRLATSQTYPSQNQRPTDDRQATNEGISQIHEGLN